MAARDDRARELRWERRERERVEARRAALARVDQEQAFHLVAAAAEAARDIQAVADAIDGNLDGNLPRYVREMYNALQVDPQANPFAAVQEAEDEHRAEQAIREQLERFGQELAPYLMDHLRDQVARAPLAHPAKLADFVLTNVQVDHDGARNVQRWTFVLERPNPQAAAPEPGRADMYRRLPAEVLQVQLDITDQMARDLARNGQGQRRGPARRPLQGRFHGRGGRLEVNGVDLGAHIRDWRLDHAPIAKPARNQFGVDDHNLADPAAGTDDHRGIHAAVQEAAAGLLAMVLTDDQLASWKAAKHLIVRGHSGAVYLLRRRIAWAVADISHITLGDGKKLDEVDWDVALPRLLGCTETYGHGLGENKNVVTWRCALGTHDNAENGTRTPTDDHIATLVMALRTDVGEREARDVGHFPGGGGYGQRFHGLLGQARHDAREALPPAIPPGAHLREANFVAAAHQRPDRFGQPPYPFPNEWWDGEAWVIPQAWDVAYEAHVNEPVRYRFHGPDDVDILILPQPGDRLDVDQDNIDVVVFGDAARQFIPGLQRRRYIPARNPYRDPDRPLHHLDPDQLIPPVWLADAVRAMGELPEEMRRILGDIQQQQVEEAMARGDVEVNDNGWRPLGGFPDAFPDAEVHVDGFFDRREPLG